MAVDTVHAITPPLLLIDNLTLKSDDHLAMFVGINFSDAYA